LTGSGRRVRIAKTERDDLQDERQTSGAGVDVPLIDEVLRMTVRPTARSLVALGNRGIPR
jgi:hypothetical protein